LPAIVVVDNVAPTPLLVNDSLPLGPTKPLFEGDVINKDGKEVITGIQSMGTM